MSEKSELRMKMRSWSTEMLRLAKRRAKSKVARQLAYGMLLERKKFPVGY